MEDERQETENEQEDIGYSYEPDEDAEEEAEAEEEEPVEEEEAEAQEEEAEPEREKARHEPALPAEVFTPEQREKLREMLASLDPDENIAAQTFIAQQTYRYEQRLQQTMQSHLKALGVTDDFQSDFAEELGAALQTAPPELRATRDGVALLVAAATAQRAAKTGDLAAAFEQALKALGKKRTARAEQGLKPAAKPAVRPVGKAGTGGAGRNRVDALIEELFMKGGRNG